MLKNNKGITLIALVVMVVVLTIVISISSYSGFTAVTTSRYYEGVSEMKIMQAKVNELYEIYRNAKSEEEKQAIINQYGTDIKSSPNPSGAEMAFQTASSDNVTESNLGSFDDYRYFSVEYIKKILDLEGIKYDFIVNIKTRSVILVEGVIRDRKMYHSLCQMKGEQYNVEYNGE